MTTLDHAARYIALGWGLCSIPRGTKGPTNKGWNNPENIATTLEQAEAMIAARPDNGLGLVHSASDTCAIDVDHLEYFRTCMEELGVNADELLAGAPRVVGNSGRDKAIFRVPAGEAFKTHKLVWPPKTAGEKPTTIFELRTGALQDVLPPTIHPDTREPYRWREGTEPWVIGVPDLPPELVAMWRDWEAFKPQLMAVCPWAPKPQAPKARPRSSGEHQNVIGQFNDAHDLGELLKANGYKPRGKRWLAPTSTSGLAGVVLFEDGTHCYSHHASDPLNDGHAHDAFGVFCLLKHGGDMGQAVADAASLLGIDSRPPTAVPVADMAEFMRRSRKENRAPALPPALAGMEKMPPSDLLTVPGVLGLVVDYANRTAPKPQPQFAVQAALALGSVLLGRNWVTTQDNYAAMYYVNVGKSASGKEHPRTVIDRILTAAGLGALLGPGGYTSDGAVFSHLHAKPCHLTIIDELGDMLGNAKAAGNFHKRQATTVLMQAWGLPAGTIRPTGYSSMSLTAKQRAELEDKCVHRPSLSLLGMTTPRTFYGSLDEQSIEGGFLNRLLVVESDLPPRVRGPFERLEVPEAVLEWIATVRAGAGEGNLSGVDLGPDVVPQARVVLFTPEAETMFAQYEAECVAEIAALDGESLAEMHGRSCEKAQRLALIVAASVNARHPLITADIARWCIRYVRHYTEQTIESIRKHLHGSEFSKWRALALESIKKGGKRGRTEFELARSCRPFAGLEPRMRRSVLDSLKSDRLAEFVDMGKGPGGRGKSRSAWVALDYETELEADDAA